MAWGKVYFPKMEELATSQKVIEDIWGIVFGTRKSSIQRFSDGNKISNIWCTTTEFNSTQIVSLLYPFTVYMNNFSIIWTSRSNMKKMLQVIKPIILWYSYLRLYRRVEGWKLERNNTQTSSDMLPEMFCLTPWYELECSQDLYHRTSPF